ncbi:MAG: dihydrolipoamide acetyltransferase family protein [Aggregatilineales bacterium]
MNTNVVLPNLGFGMEEGKLIAWLKQPGDAVKKGEPIAEIESDKATVQLEAVVDGTLTETLYPADSVVPVGAVLAHISTGSEAPSTRLPSSPETESRRASPLARRMAAGQGISLSNVTGTGPGGRITRSDLQPVVTNQGANGRRVLAAPAVRKLARDQHIDLQTIQGTGKDGHITRADVESALAQADQPAPAAETLEIATAPVSQLVAERRDISLSNMRRAIGKQLAQSMQDVPHFYVTAELDLTPALKQLPGSIGLNALLLYLTVKTLKTIPELNATYEGGHLYQYDNVNLSIAVALPNGLISPVLHRADDYSLSRLAERAKDLIMRARRNHLRPEELSEGTFTVSNLGIVQQIERFTAIISLPQVAILAVGAAKPRPFVIDGGLHVRTTVHLTLSVDHRIADGLTAARFLEAFDGHLQAFALTP